MVNELILVVDDEPKIVKLARDYLEQAGFRVQTAGDGQTALAPATCPRPTMAKHNAAVGRRFRRWCGPVAN